MNLDEGEMGMGMAKRPLRWPVAPADSARMDFFVALQRLVTESGDKSVHGISILTKDDQFGDQISHQTVYSALTGPKVPTFSVAKTVVGVLGGDWERQFKRLWVEAVGEERTGNTLRHDGSSSSDVQRSGSDSHHRAMNRFVEELRELRIRRGQQPMQQIRLRAMRYGHTVSASSLYILLAEPKRFPSRRVVEAFLAGVEASADERQAAISMWQKVRLIPQ